MGRTTRHAGGRLVAAEGAGGLRSERPASRSRIPTFLRMFLCMIAGPESEEKATRRARLGNESAGARADRSR
jgi:hypothetical protein